MRNKILCAVIGLFLLVSFSRNAWSGDEIHTFMRPDLETLIEWAEIRKNAPLAFIDEELMTKIPLTGSLSLLSHLQYIPGERQQGYCGNCWTWSGTGIMAIALSVQNGIKDRLSIQYINSCRTTEYACCGGLLSKFVDFYAAEGHMIPWSNTNAHFQDASRQCSDGSSLVSCGSISTSPSYTISSLTHQVVQTQGVGQSTAITNIKNVLHQNRGVEFGFYMPTESDGNNFQNFWNNSSESVIWNPDFKGHTWDEEYGGGHATLIVGYNDDDDTNSYWIVLNSWGTTANRPTGLFRLDMNVNYDCQFYAAGYGNIHCFDFETLSVEYTGGTVTTTIGPTTTTTIPPSSTTTTAGGCPPDYPIDCLGDGSHCCPIEAPICCYDAPPYCCYIDYPICGTGLDEGYCFQCVAGILLNNDETQLDVLKEMRDARLASTELGSSLIDLYYEHTEEISDIVGVDEALKVMAANVVGEIVEKAASLNNNEEVGIDQELVGSILEVADAINAKASPELKMAIKKVKREIKKGTIFRELGIKAAENYR